MSPDPPRPPATLLRSVPWLADVPEAALEELAGTTRVERLPAGAVLYRQGDEATDLSVVISGRLRAVSPDGPSGVDREIGRGDPVGEIGLLTGDPRAATVIAVRDSVILRLDRSGVDSALAASPGLTRSLVRVVAERLREPSRVRTTVGTVGLLGTRDGPAPVAIVDDLAAALRGLGRSVAVPGRDGVVDPVDASGLQGLVDAAERAGDIALLPLDGRRAGWDRAGARQVDMVLLAAEVHDGPRLGEGARSLLADLAADGLTPRRELALLHPPGTQLPHGTPGWATATGATQVHHLRAGDLAGPSRLARHLIGRTVALVLSGGGARAMAHLGAYRALTEAGVAIDRVGGSSIGGVVGLQIAMGAPPAEIIELDRREFPAAAFGRRMTLPVISLFSVRKAIELFERIFGELDVSDMWKPSFVTTVDLTTCMLEIREQGRAATWARATSSPPGLWPPVVDERGHLIVDGGVLDNLPVLPMRALGASVVIAVNVSGRRQLAVAETDADIVSWLGYLRRLAAVRGTPTFPSVTAVLMRLGLVTSLAAQAAAAAQVDLLVEPPVDGFTMANYRRFGDIVEAGYRATAAALESGTLELPTP